MPTDARTLGRGERLALDQLAAPYRRHPLAAARAGAAGLLFALAALLLMTSDARAAANCPPIHNKPHAIPHVNYPGVRHITYCDGPITVKPGQNIIRLNG